MNKEELIKKFIKSNKWRLYISREINLATEVKMSRGWLKYISTRINKSTFRRVNVCKNGVADIYVCDKDIAVYKKWLLLEYERDRLDNVWQDCWSFYERARQVNVKNVAEILAPALVLPRLVEISLTSKKDWRDDKNIGVILDKFSQINEDRRNLMNKQNTPRAKNSEEWILCVNNEQMLFQQGEVTDYEKFLPTNYSDKRSDCKLVGQSVCDGKVKGSVRLIAKKSDYQKIKKGEIVVTSMTQPEIYSAIAKIKGIITDEGGVLCHAAVLARESRIPCLTSTKVATKMIKSGDVVTLNATNEYALLN